MRIDFFMNRTFCEPKQKFDRTSTGLAYSEPKLFSDSILFSGISSLHK
jgi:hypothetical protein